MDVEGSVSYILRVIVNGNGRDVVKGADNIRANLWDTTTAQNLLIIVLSYCSL